MVCLLCSILQTGGDCRGIEEEEMSFKAKHCQTLRQQDLLFWFSIWSSNYATSPEQFYGPSLSQLESCFMV